MAKAIGWYVHYTEQGYKEHGISTRGKKGISIQGKERKIEIPSQKNFIRSKAKNLTRQVQITRRELDELQKIMSLSWSALSQNQDAQEEIQEKIVNKLKESAEQVILDYSTGKAKKNEGVATSGISSNWKGSTLRLGQHIEDIIRRLFDIQGDMHDIIETRGDKDELKKSLEAFKKEADDIYKVYVKQLENFDISTKGARFPNRIGEKDLLDLRRRVNEFIRDKNLGVPAVATAQGILFEELLSHLPILAESIAGGAVDKAILEAVKNAEVAFVGDDTEDIIWRDDVFEQKITVDNSTVISRTERNVGSSQGKVDITLSWKSSPLKISAKNYDLSKAYWIHLVSNTYLAFMLQDIDIDFINHFLNLYVEHHKDYPENGEKEGKKVNTLNSERKKIKQELALILLYKALTGDNYGRKAANIFAINDASTGKVILLTPEEVLNKVLANGSVTEDVSIHSDIGYLEDWGRGKGLFPNPWSENMYARINKVLAAFKARKISVSVRSAVLTGKLANK